MILGYPGVTMILGRKGQRSRSHSQTKKVQVGWMSVYLNFSGVDLFILRAAVKCVVLACSSTIGPTGSRGFTGMPGYTGATGIKGEPGWTGPRGVRGAVGSTGASGVTGSTGPTGPSGRRGQPGFTGSTGPVGFPGATGMTGPVGITGATGPVILLAAA